MKAKPDALSFGEMLQRLYAEKHTGQVLVHFAGGKPSSIELLKPSERIALDNGNGCAHT